MRNSVKSWIETLAERERLLWSLAQDNILITKSEGLDKILLCSSPALEQISSCSPVTKGKDSGQGDLGKFVFLKNYLCQFKLLLHICCLWQVTSSPFWAYFFKCKMKGLDKWFLRSLPTLKFLLYEWGAKQVLILYKGLSSIFGKY